MKVFAINEHSREQLIQYIVHHVCRPFVEVQKCVRILQDLPEIKVQEEKEFPELHLVPSPIHFPGGGKDERTGGC